VFFDEFVRQTIEIGLTRERGVKSGVENGHVRQRRENAACFADTGDVDRIVQRRERLSDSSSANTGSSINCRW
jgi:hypothetical protein